MSDEDEFVLAKSVSHLLHRAQQLAADHFARRVQNKFEYDITLRQFALLSAVIEKPGVSQSELVQITSIDRSTLADMIKRMEDRGWVKRMASKKDGRANALKVQPAGLRVFTEVERDAVEADHAVLREIPKKKRDALIDRLERLSSAADKKFKLDRRSKRKAKNSADKEATKVLGAPAE